MSTIETVITKIQNELKNRKHTHFGIYSDVGIAIEKFSTVELLQYYISICGEAGIRSYIETGIIENEISKERYKNRKEI